MAVPPSKARNFRFARRRLGHARRSLRRKTTENEDIMSVVNTPRETQETPSHARISFTRGTKAHHPRYSYNSLAYITPVFHALPLSYSLTRSFFLSFPLSPAVSSIFFSLSLSLSLSLVRSLFLSLSLPARSTLLPLSLLVPFFYRARLSSSFVYSTLNTLPKKTTATMTITMTTVMVTFPAFLFSSLPSFVRFLPSSHSSLSHLQIFRLSQVKILCFSCVLLWYTLLLS